VSLVDADTPVPDAAALGAVHFIGVGGISMSGLAAMMRTRGLTVSGSDARDSRELTALRALGVRTSVGHDAGAVSGADTVVVSSAIRPDNPELVAARAAGLRVLPRVVALVSLMAGRRVAAVTGTHGKTTTTSMLTVAMQSAGYDPSFAIGGQLSGSGANAHEGTGDVFVAEADESDGSFLLVRPEVGVVTNVEADHLDNYGTAAAYRAAFDAFADRVRPGGVLVVGIDDPGAAQLARSAIRRYAGDGSRRRVVPVGADAAAPEPLGSHPSGSQTSGLQTSGFQTSGLQVAGTVLQGSGSQSTVALRRPGGGRWEATLRLRVPGRHNVADAACALAAAVQLGADPDVATRALGDFTGTRRRFEAKGSAGGVRVVDEYAHHPTEVAAAIAAGRVVAAGGRVLAVFQPHLYSRTRIFAAEFAAALGGADEVVVMEVYGAREEPDPEVSGSMIADAVPLPSERVLFSRSWTATPAAVAARARPGDLVLTIGAGDVTMIGPQVLALLAAGIPERGNAAAGIPERGDDAAGIPERGDDAAGIPERGDDAQ